MLLPLARHHQPISSCHSICFPLLQFDCPFPLPKSKPYRQNPTRVSMLLPIRSFTRLSLFLFKWKFDFMEMNHSTVACREKREPPTAGALDAFSVLRSNPPNYGPRNGHRHRVAIGVGVALHGMIPCGKLKPKRFRPKVSFGWSMWKRVLLQAPRGKKMERCGVWTWVAMQEIDPMFGCLMMIC